MSHLAAGFFDRIVGRTRPEPRPHRARLCDVVGNRLENDVGNRLLLASQMILEQLVARNVARVHAGDGVVHEKFRVDLRHARDSSQGAVALTEIVAPFGQLPRSSFPSAIWPDALSAGNNQACA